MSIAMLSTFAAAALGAAVAFAEQDAPPGATPAPAPPAAAATSAIILPSTPAPAPVRRIDLAICLDTSGSMEGLIDAARMKLWEIVNDLALADPTPELRVALLTFGNDGHDAAVGWVNVDAELTQDLDLISQKLFALTTNGGTELVGRVTAKATELDWHPSEDALKLIIVAGNESADQDKEVPFRDACRRAIGNGIMINAIYCGNPADDIAPAWREVARLADGHFAAIDQQKGTIVVTTPFDARLAEISALISSTYIPYGEAGRIAWANQAQQDANAAGMNTATAAVRCETKATALYRNTQWDLVDGCAEQVVKLEELEDDQLPEILRPMTLEQRKAYVESKGAERAKLQEEASRLGQQRTAYVTEEMKKQSLDASRSFGHVVRQAVRSQAEAKGFRFEPEPESQPETTPPADPAGKADDGC